MPTKAKKRSKGRAWKLAILLVVVLLAALVGVVGYLLALQPVLLEGEPQTQIVEIAAGQGAPAIGALLEERGLIRHAWAFTIQTYLTGDFRRLQAGYYQLSDDTSTAEIIAALAQGKSALRKVTFPEGLVRYEMAPILEKEQICDSAAFLGASGQEAVEQVLGTKLPDKAGVAEGFLFPDTYLLGIGDDPDRLVTQMVGRFKEQFFDPYWLPASRTKPWGNLFQVVTLASLVEKEAKHDSERPLIAGVLLGRLRKTMLLQCDATVQYALGAHKSRLTFEDLKVNSPYNTYLHKGLPPGPLCNPGLPSLRAALNPQATDYLFYVAKPDGTHAFSRTFEEHQAAIKSLRGRQ